MPVTQQDGRALWQGQPTPCCLCLLSCQPTQCGANSEGSTDTVGGALRRCRGVARVGKIGVNGFKHGKDWKGAGLHCQNGQTDRCGKNRKGFQVKELWRWEIRSLHPDSVCEGGKWRCDKIWWWSHCFLCIMLLWWKNRLLRWKQLPVCFTNQKRENLVCYDDLHSPDMSHFPK